MLNLCSVRLQAMNLSVFPPLKVTNTDVVTEGQIYIRSVRTNGCVALGWLLSLETCGCVPQSKCCCARAGMGVNPQQHASTL